MTIYDNYSSWNIGRIPLKLALHNPPDTPFLTI